MRAFTGGWARGVVVLAAGSVLLFTGCSRNMMGEKTMMDKEVTKEGMMKDEKKEMMKEKELQKP
jgi:hypothetical protein